MESNVKNMNLSANKKTEKKEFVMPEECAESEKALNEMNKENLKAQYDFINLVTLVFILLCAATVFIIFTSSTRYGDEGNQFTLERLVSGEYTAEIQSRYEENMPFPQQITWLEEHVSLLYGFGNSVSDSAGGGGQEENQNPNSFDQPGQSGHEENSVTTTTAAEREPDETETSRETTPVYETTYSRTTEETSAVSQEEETTSAATTTNNDPPGATTTTTATAPVESETEQTTTTTPSATTTTTTTTTATTTTTTTTVTTTTTAPETEAESAADSAGEE